jgi:hypothetical protein
MTGKTWRKSTYSGNENVCVELAVGSTETNIRDSKAPAEGALTFHPAPFARLLTAVTMGEFDGA